MQNLEGKDGKLKRTLCIILFLIFLQGCIAKDAEVRVKDGAALDHWIHLELKFKNYEILAKDFSKEASLQKKPEGSYKELMIYLKNVVDSLSKVGLIRRYFFLFEPKLDLFLALEMKDVSDFKSIEEKIERIPRSKFIDSYEIKPNTGDGSHPEGALDFFCASTKYAFFRVSDDYKPGYKNHDETKIIHCFANQLFSGDWNNEIEFYINGLVQRDVTEIKWKVQGRYFFIEKQGENQYIIKEFFNLRE